MVGGPMKWVPPITSTRISDPQPERDSRGTVAEGTGCRAHCSIGHQAKDLYPVPHAPMTSQAALDVPLTLSCSPPANLLAAESSAQSPSPETTLEIVPGLALQQVETIGRKVPDPPLI